MKTVWRKTAEFHLKGDEPSAAAKSLEELLKANPNDKTTLAQLVLAYAKFDLKKAMEISKKLPDFVSKSVDADAERWLPRRERTGYRRTRKERRKGDKFTGAQGTSASQQETFDYSQKKAAAEGAIKKQKSPTVVPEPPVGPRQQRGKPQPKKKKGKKQF